MPLHFAVFSEKVWVCKFGSKNDKFPPKYLYNMKISVNLGPYLLHFMAFDIKRAKYPSDESLVILKALLRHRHKFIYLKAKYIITKTLYSILSNNMNFSVYFWAINLVTFYNFDITNQ
jgi:hypothetical protein